MNIMNIIILKMIIMMICNMLYELFITVFIDKQVSKFNILKCVILSFKIKSDFGLIISWFKSQVSEVSFTSVTSFDCNVNNIE